MDNILITGANQGFGLALAQEFLDRGDMVFAGAHSPSQTMEALAKRYPDRLVQTSLDVTSEPSIAEFRNLVERSASKIDILINNAGVNLTGDRPPITEIDLGKMLTTFDVNAAGPARILKYFMPLVQRSERKLIVNISSESGSIADSRRTVEYDYCMSKAALNMLTRLVHNYGQPLGLKVISVHPGWMRTRMGGASAKFAPEETAHKLIVQLERSDYRSLPIFMDYAGKSMNW